MNFSHQHMQKNSLTTKNFSSFDAHFLKNLELPYKENGKFDLQTIEVDECIAELRFAKHDKPFLVQTLDLPDKMWCYQGPRFSCIEGICLLLRRPI